MEFTFTPDSNQQQIDVPYFEDARADFAPYYTVYSDAKRRRKGDIKVLQVQTEVSYELGKLGGFVTGILPGTFGSGKTKRHGYEIRFMYSGNPGIIRVAGLPMRKETPDKKLGVLVQALSIVRDWLKAAVTQRTFSPGSDVLIPFLLVDGKHTVADYIASQGKLPMLNPPPDHEVIDGEITS